MSYRDTDYRKPSARARRAANRGARRALHVALASGTFDGWEV